MLDKTSDVSGLAGTYATWAAARSGQKVEMVLLEMPTAAPAVNAPDGPERARKEVLWNADRMTWESCSSYRARERAFIRLVFHQAGGIDPDPDLLGRLFGALESLGLTIQPLVTRF